MSSSSLARRLQPISLPQMFKSLYRPSPLPEEVFPSALGAAFFILCAISFNMSIYNVLKRYG